MIVPALFAFVVLASIDRLDRLYYSLLCLLLGLCFAILTSGYLT